MDIERDQLPLWLPVGLGGGISAWFVLPDASAWGGFVLLAAALAALGLAAGQRRSGRALTLFALAACLGCCLVWGRALLMEAPRLDRARMTSVDVRVEAVQPLPARKLVRLLVDPVDPALPRLRVNLDERHMRPEIAAGASIRFRAYLMPPPPMAVPGAFDFARTAYFQRIGGTGRVLGGATVLRPADPGWRNALAGLRQRLAEHIRAQLPGTAGAIASALATGDQGAIPEEDAEAMRASGLAHLLSVSGLHLTAVVGAVMIVVLRLLALSPTLALRWPLVTVAAGAAALAGIAYTLMTGAEVPTIRACVAALLVLLGIAIGRDALTLRLVGVGALVVLLLWPEVIVGPSFQLSFAAIVAIVALHDHPRVRALLSRREEGIAARLGRGLIGLVLTGLAVEVALMPIALFHFHKAGFYGALANVVAIPLTTFVVMPLEALALLLDLAGLGAPAWWLCGHALDLLIALAHAVAAAPGAVAMLPSMPPLAFGLMAGGGLWLALWRSGWRVLGLAPIAAGAALAIATPAPDLIITGDGRHLALRTGESYAILRGRAGDYVRDMLGEAAGEEGELPALDTLPAARCSADLCVADIVRDGRSWRVLATRSRAFLDFAELRRACAAADIVVSERSLPRTCRPTWLKADHRLLEQTGGVAIMLDRTPTVRTVSEYVGDHPWARGPHPGQSGWRNSF